jgi:DNA helicase-2/ATP-dependent DNA helicase PcrA
VADARYLESYYAAEYGMPTMVFHTRGRRLALTQHHVDRLYKEIDTRSRARRLMSDLLIFPDYPHHRAGAITSRTHSRKIVNFTMFGDPRRYFSHEHRIQLVSSDEAFREAVSLVTKTRQQATYLACRNLAPRVRQGLAFAQSLCQDNDAEVVHRARLTPGKSFQFMPASHLRPGMVVPVAQDGEVREARVARSRRGHIADLSTT